MLYVPCDNVIVFLIFYSSSFDFCFVKMVLQNCRDRIFYCMDGNTRNIHKYTLYTRLQHFPQPSALKRIFHAYSTLVARIEAIKRGKHDSAFFLIFFYRLFAPHMGRFFLYSHLIYSSYYIEFSFVALAAALWP